MTDMTAEQIKRTVSERYGARARKAAQAAEVIPLEVVSGAADACCDDDKA